MLDAAIATRGKPNSLHRLGIAAHVFVDTFAHQGFAGLHHRINTAHTLRDAKGRPIEVMEVPPVGHGQVGTCPARPFLRWSYIDHADRVVRRDNPKDYATASMRLCEAFQRYRGVPATGLTAPALDKLETLFVGLTQEDGHARHREWLRRLVEDYFGFGAVALGYEGKADGSWKDAALGPAHRAWQNDCLDKAQDHCAAHGESFLHRFSAFSGKALQTLEDRLNAAADYFDANLPIEAGDHCLFLDSHYRHFHDAAKQQRFDVFQVILPSFGIVAA